MGDVDLWGRLQSVNYRVFNACCDDLGHLDKVSKFALAIFEGYYIFIERSESVSATMSVLKTCSKLLAGVLIFGDSPYWTKENPTTGRPDWESRWEENPIGVMGVVAFHTGHVIDFMRLSTDLGLELFTNMGAQLGQYPVLEPVLNIGLSKAKSLCVVFGGTFACLGVIWSIYYARENEINGEFVEKQMAQFLANIGKAIVVSAIISGSPITPVIFTSGVILGAANTWKYIMEMDKGTAQPEQLRRAVAAQLEAAGRVTFPS